ncbi:Fe(3+)-hydroxamate ABC transporter permease FhuB [Rodentibacter pneumotropicus]|uniref:Fe(3+)-hydroxamate ABC transporter permease FhuB n=1 Tax=Rodentibacter pneumotropicus TaxID=758 RepID=A0A4S2P866_9PAST|nr:Fe(3+)-hydroxamate ABC transporter permease FhuB [Rodentibacter pneumotropicus]TGZ99209.1 Fe(3+)-hydroxamate ABC transporter permease FhuB [Rodentibacter pneumotropicus]TGZ99464.1 Fe(3+)-hydroxamate ABC transporter permease FhuB [Rodentibacter pneumotropicus]THA09061.1 Fe(3+)-hydroxamate ABC transporter permease FhuB [Rodentibacter pneumotropicus]THA16789.1 Fe(3+)-hydroxamate ABC transporter permease FhuB [Rodentibacter pneumotropicus]
MVNRNTLLFMFLGGLFCALSGFLFAIQLPENIRIFELFQPTDNLDLLLLQSYTLPRITIALLAGGILAFASLLLQQVMGNPLASDSTLGINSGAQFSLFGIAIFAPQLLQYSSSLIALVGAAFSLLLVLALAMRKTMPPLLLILAGLVVNLYFGACTTMMMLFYPEESRGLVQWGAGSLVQESWYDSQLLAIQSAVCFFLIFLLRRPLTILTLNDSNAKSLGVPVGKLRFIGVVISAYLIASVVSAVGMIGFIGLAAATMVRQLGIRTLTWQLITSFILGALLLAITDLILQLISLYYQVNLPTGAVTALIGTPLLLWLMFRSLPHSGRLTGATLQKVRQYRPHFTWLIIAFFAISFIMALGLGKTTNNTWQILTPAHPFNLEILALRYPRMLIAVCAGILLSVAGVLLQHLTLNSMASPELLGVSSGAGMGILLSLFVFSSQAPLWFWLSGISGAFIALMMLATINQRNGMLPEKVLLTGISLSALFDTLQRIAIASGDPRANQLISWSSGSTQTLAPTLAVPFTLLTLLLLASSLVFSRWLDLLRLQAPIAQALGLNISQTRWILIIFSAILTALATLIVGPLSFIGLLVPHLTYFLGVHTARQQLLISALLGSTIMLIADWIGRQILFPYEIPAGLVATLVGGSYFLLMMRKV